MASLLLRILVLGRPIVISLGICRILACKLEVFLLDILCIQSYIYVRVGSELSSTIDWRFTVDGIGLFNITKGACVIAKCGSSRCLRK